MPLYQQNKNKIAAWFNSHQSHFFILFVFLFFICVIISTGYYSKNFIVIQARPAAGVTSLFNATTIITGIAFFCTQILLFCFLFLYRTKAGRTSRFITGNLKLELLWTLIPAFFFMCLFIWGQILWRKIIQEPDDDVLKIEVVAEQFNWQVRYAGMDNKLGKASFRFINTVNMLGIDPTDPAGKDDFIPVQMHIPKNRPVLILLRSKDVIHSFFIPLFGTKMDAVPGMTTSMHFTPTSSTHEMRKKLQNPEFNYEVACAELCGRMHFAMKLILVVDEPEQFDRWYAEQKSWMANDSNR